MHSMTTPLVDPAVVAAIQSADARIRPTALETPVVEWLQYAERVGGPVFVKAEHLQRTGSFKLRGATNAVANAIAASVGGRSFGLALRSDGRLLSWGDNAGDQLGNTTLPTTGTSTPTEVPGFSAGP